MKKNTSLCILLAGGIYFNSITSLLTQDNDLPKSDSNGLHLINEDKNQPNNQENSNLEEDPDIILEKEKNKILENAKIYQCYLKEQEPIQVAILENGEAYIFHQNYFKKILLEEVNPEDMHIVCENNEIIIEYKKPLTNIKLQKIYKLKNHEFELIGSKKHDEIQDYVEELFLKALEGKKTEIIKLVLTDLSFSYQYINYENIYNLLNRAIEKSKNVTYNKAINIFEASGILLTKLIYYYHFNQTMGESELLDFKKWITALEQIGIENFEIFFVKYAETLIHLNSQNGVEILKYLMEKKENYIEPYVLLGNYYWAKNQKDLAKEYYKKALSISKMQKEYEDSNENTLNSVKIPEYIYVRISE